jgi:hypothetical protein
MKISVKSKERFSDLKRPPQGHIFFKHTQKPFYSTAPNFIEIGPMAWISIVDTHTHTHTHKHRHTKTQTHTNTHKHTQTHTNI